MFLTKAADLFPVSGHYDNPEELRGASANRNDISNADSLKFAAGACFDNHDTSAFYENPLAVPLAPQRVDSLEQRPTAGGTETPYDNPLAAKNNSGTFSFRIVMELDENGLAQVSD